MQDISFKDFKDMNDDNKWQYVWNVLTNHFHQIKEMKWLIRIMTGGMVTYFLKIIYTAIQSPK